MRIERILMNKKLFNWRLAAIDLAIIIVLAPTVISKMAA